MKGALIAAVILGVVGIGVYYSGSGSLEDGARSDVGASLVNDDTVSPLIEQTSLEVQDFEVQTTAGETVKLSELVDDKPTMVGFWASWCPNCRRNLPVQNELFKQYKDQVNIIEINLGESRAAVDRYDRDTNYDFHMAYDENNIVSSAWNVPYTNAHFLIGADGTLLQAFPGDINETHFEQLVATIETSGETE